MKALFKFFAERHLLANALTVMILLLGGFSLLTMNREEFPNADTDTVEVEAKYPGASPEDVELDVTNELEDALKGIVGRIVIYGTWHSRRTSAMHGKFRRK